MKKKNFFLTFMMSFVALCLFSACSSDDDGPISDPASVIAGTYVGTGTETDRMGLNITYGEYHGMKMKVVKSSNEFVVITPEYADGNSYFGGSGIVFQVTQQANGGFLLTSSEYPMARVTIAASGAMDFYFPYVVQTTSDGDQISLALSFTGSKQ